MVQSINNFVSLKIHTEYLDASLHELVEKKYK